MKKKRIFFQGVGVFFLMGSATLVYFFPPSFLRVQEIVILNPVKNFSQNDLVKLMGVKKGDSLLRLRLAQTRANLLRYPWIREARLSKRFPGRLIVDVVEEKAVALLELEGFYLVNEKGRIFKPVDEKDIQDFPIITGLSRENLKPLKEMSSLLLLLSGTEALREMKISEIRWRKNEGALLFTEDPVVRIDLGMSPWEEKISRLALSWETILVTVKKPRWVDLNLKRRIIVKKGGG